MTTPSNDELRDSHILVMRIILFSLILGVVTFFTIAFILAPAGQKFGPHPWRVTMPLGAVAAVFSLCAVVLSFVVPRLQAEAMIRKMPELPINEEVARTGDGKSPERTAQLLAVAQTRMIVGAALLEGAAFLDIVTYLTEKGAIPVATAAGLLVLMASKFPTRFGLENWVDERRTSRGFPG